MKKRTKWIILLVASIAVLTTAIGVMALSTNARAHENAFLGESPEIFQHLGGPGFPGGEPGGDQYLADALGVSVEELQTAEQEAGDAAVQQAVEQGLITQEQADAMILRGFPFGGRFGFHGGFGLDGGIDYDALLADALGIDVEELQSAREEAQSARLAEAVADGTLTQEQADLIQAREALKSYLDPQALFAEALGISVEQLQAYRDEDLSLSEILAEVGMTAAEVREAQQAATQAALEQAVADGVITQEQADQLQAGGFRGFGRFGRGPAHEGGRGGFGDFGGWNPAPDAPAPTDTGNG